MARQGKNLIDPTRYQTTNPRWGAAEVRALLPHRFEFEQLGGVVELDKESGLVVGFARHAQDAFWVRGHVPGAPILPGVLMIEAAAQLGAWYCLHVFPDRVGFWALGAVDRVRYRGVVRPGETLLIACRFLKLRTRLMRLQFQGFVGESRVVEGEITGVCTPELGKAQGA